MFDVFYIGKKPNLFAHEQCANSVEHAQQLSRTRFCWVVNYLADYLGFDFLWEPVPWQAQQTHVWPSQHHEYSGTYLIPKEPTDQTNFHTTIIPNKASRHNWKILHPINEDAWDWTWAPHPLDPPYIYVWGNQHWPAEQMPTVEYHVPGATQRKFMHVPAQLKPNRKNWATIKNADVSSIDFSWVPDPCEPPYNYVFGNQWYPAEIMPTATYRVSGAKEDKFMDIVVPLLPTRDNWEVLEPIAEDEWNWAWVPNPKDPSYIYVFGNQWNPAEFKASVRYVVPGATEVKYMDQRTRRLPDPDGFEKRWPNVEFDWSWEPNPFDPPYTYVFGNQWNPGVIEPTVIYMCDGGSEYKYIDDLIATIQPFPNAFNNLVDVAEFDYSWRPNPKDPPYIYVFGNQWHPAEIMPTVEYRVGAATERKYMDFPKAKLPERHCNRWHTIEDCEWDYSWIPDPGDPPYVYVFGNQWHSAEVMPTLTYTVPGATERKYVDYPRARLLDDMMYWNNRSEHRYHFDYSWKPDPGEPPMIYVFGNQHWPAEKMPTVEWSHPDITEDSPIKYVDYPVATLLPNKTLWKVPPNVKEEQVDYTWVPDPGEPPYIYQFATQHQKTGGPVYTMPGATEIKYLEHVQVEIKTATVPIIEIDHLDGNAGKIPNTLKKIRYFDNYRDTLIRLAKSLLGQHEFVWVCSSICDYSSFDFSWHPEKWQGTMLHVFASNEQKFGDTFYMHVPTFAARAEKKALLEWYSVNYVPRIVVPRNKMPVIEHTGDSQVDAVKNTDWPGPLALFTTNGLPMTIPAVPLWRQEVKTVMPLSNGASAVIVPRVAVGDIRTQLYDYPYIDKTQRKRHYDQPLDIVFISNGENEADFLYQWLLDSIGGNSLFTTTGSYRIKRVENVKGRVAAYQAAANASTTPWFFAVFAKLQVNKEFNWNWQPDRMQQAKHYIFHAINPVNGLTYGHQAMIAYNKKLVLENEGLGLDFTLDQPHEVVPIVSGQANYYTSNWMCWRTAFREAIKLKASLPDVENEYRLNQWLTKDSSAEQWSMKGAQDAVEFYDAVNGNPTELRKSYEWDWLASYAFMKRSLVAN